MKTGKKIKIGIGIVLLILLVVGIVYMAMKASAATQLKLGGVGMAVDKNKNNLTKVLGGTLPFLVNVDIVNYSSVPLLLNQTSLEIYSQDEKKIGGQTLPLTKPVQIAPITTTTITLPFEVSIANLVKTFKDVSFEDWVNYYYTGKPIGKKIKVNGFVIAEAIKVNINMKEVDI